MRLPRLLSSSIARLHIMLLLSMYLCMLMCMVVSLCLACSLLCVISASVSLSLAIRLPVHIYICLPGSLCFFGYEGASVFTVVMTVLLSL